VPIVNRESLKTISLFSCVVLALSGCAQVGSAALSGALQGLSTGSSRSESTPAIAKAVYDPAELFPEVTRIQLRAMQTRTFKKTPSEVFAAITSLCRDSNGQMTGMLPMYKGVGKVIGETRTPLSANAYTSVYKYERYEKDAVSASLAPTCYRATGLGGGEFSIKGQPGIYKGVQVMHELDWDPNEPTAVVVRMRISWATYVVGPPSKQTTNAAFYQRAFKDLADGLFIDAIELNPQAME